MSRINLTVENLESNEGLAVNTISAIITCFCFYVIKDLLQPHRRDAIIS